MTSKIVVNNIEADAGVSTVTFGSKISSTEFVGPVVGNVTGNLTGTASTATAAATAYGLSGSPTLSGITSVSTSNLTVNGNAYPTAGPLSNRNLIINGAMNVAQRGTQITGSTSGGYTCDRFQLAISSLGTWTLDQSSDSPNGFNNSVKATCTTAVPSPAAGNNIQFLYKVEAQDLQCLSYGNSGAKAAILSFWVKSNKTGNATVEFFQSDNSNRMLSQEYTINSADTWEYKTISIPADTSGLFNDDNGLGMEIGFWLNTGSTFTSGSLKTVWGAYSAGSRNPSNLGVGGATSDYFAITGVQLEVGTVATPFEHRSYGDELLRCRRYCQVYGGATYTRFGISSAYSNTAASVVTPLSTPMRTLPSITTTGNFRHELPGVTSVTVTAFTMDVNGSDTSFIKYDITHSSNGNFTGSKSGQVATNNDTSARFILSAEL